MFTWRLAACSAVVLLCATPARAHHEAIYGAQSSLGLSAARYLTAQVFTRSTGPSGQRVQETTTVLSGGFSPRQGPISLSFVAPFSVIAGEPGRGTHIGLENTIVAGRYRVALSGVNRAIGTEETYLLGVSGIEIPTGTIDHGFFEVRLRWSPACPSASNGGLCR